MKTFAFSVSVAAALLASSVSAQDGGTDLTVGQVPAANLQQIPAPLAFPSVYAVPSAVAPAPNSGFVGGTFVTPRDGIEGNDNDGSVVGGYSIGNAATGVSLTFGLVITGIDPFGDSGALSLNASRLLGFSDTSATFIGASASGLAGWGDADGSERYNVYLSHVVGIRTGGGEVPVQLTVGYGTDAIIESDGTGDRDDGFYAGFGVGLTRDFSASMSFTETQANLGLTYSVPNAPVSITAGMTDITDETDRQQFTLSVGFGF